MFFSRARRVLLLVGVLMLTNCKAAQPQPTIACAAPTVIGQLGDPLNEASGLALSEQHPGVIWMIDDHGATVLHAVDSTGRYLGGVNVAGATLTNWEDLGMARCGTDTCLYIADIGDNLRRRETISVFRVVEPDPSDAATQPVTKFTFRYPDKPHDAEAMFVLPGERIFIVTKGRSEPITVYHAPDLTADTIVLEPVQTLSPSFVQLPDLVTGGTAKLDGSLIALRTYSSLQLYRPGTDTLEALLPGKGIDLTPLHEPQGEGVAVRSDDVLFLNSERGPFGETQQPPVSRVECRASS